MGSDDVLSLRDYLAVLRRQAWLVVLTTVLVVAAAVAVSLLETPIYEARTEVVLEPVRRTQDLSLEQLLSPANTVVQTERIIITSRPVTDRALQELGATDPTALVEQVRVEVLRDTRVVEIIAEDPDPVAAASIANAYAEAYLEFRRDQAVDEVLAARANIDRRAEGLREQITALDLEIDAAGTDDASALQVQRDSLLAQLAQVVSQQAELGETVDAITGGGAVIAPAEVSDTPISPRPLRTGALALVLGLLLGVGFAFLRDHFDDVIRDEADFKRATGGRPILGRIPRWEPGAGAEQRLATLLEPSSLAAESYRELSAGVRFLLVAHRDPAAAPAPADEAEREVGASRVGQSIMVVSANAGEGKSSTAANLAVAAARVGLSTVLVDADLRRATLHKRFGLSRGTGLAEVLLGDGEVIDHAVEVGVDNLLLLPAGSIPPNPTELLASPAMRLLQAELARAVDLVIYDTPATLAVPDPLELGRFVDLAILVARTGQTSRRQLASAIERLEQVGTDLAGTVLNGIDTRSDGYYYSYYYEDREESSGKPSRRGKGKGSGPGKKPGKGSGKGAGRSGTRDSVGRETRQGAAERPAQRSGSTSDGNGSALSGGPFSARRTPPSGTGHTEPSPTVRTVAAPKGGTARDDPATDGKAGEQRAKRRT